MCTKCIMYDLNIETAVTTHIFQTVLQKTSKTFWSVGQYTISELSGYSSRDGVCSSSGDKGVGPVLDYPKSSWTVFGLATPSNTLSLGRYVFKKVRLIEADPSITFPRLPIGNQPLTRSKQLIFLNFVFALRKSHWKTIWIVNRMSDPLIPTDSTRAWKHKP